MQSIIFLRIRTDKDIICAEELRRRLILRRKKMKIIDKIMKCKDISMATKIRIVNTVAFPVVM